MSTLYPIAQHAGLFFAVLFFGLPAYVFALYISTVGTLNTVTVVIVSFLAILTSDIAWYGIGKKAGEQGLDRIAQLRPYRGRIERLVGKIEGRIHTVIFIARFAYGTKILVNMVSGSINTRFKTFVALSAASLSLWLSFVTVCTLFLIQFVNVHNVIATVRGGVLLLIFFFVIFRILSALFKRHL